jgi:hypothetical protein
MFSTASTTSIYEEHRYCMYTHIDALGFTEYDSATVATRTILSSLISQTPPWRRLAYVWLPIRSRAFDLFLIYMPLNSNNTPKSCSLTYMRTEAERDVYSVSRYESRTHRPHVLHWRLFAQRVWRQAARTRANDDDPLSSTILELGIQNRISFGQEQNSYVYYKHDHDAPERPYHTERVQSHVSFHEEDDKYAPMTLEQFRASIRNVHAHIPMPNRIDAKKLHDVYE